MVKWKASVGAEIVECLASADRALHQVELLLELGEACRIDARRRPCRGGPFDLDPHVAQIDEPLEGQGRNADRSSRDDRERMGGTEPLQRFADRHGADAEGLRQALDRDQLSRRDAAVEDQIRPSGCRRGPAACRVPAARHRTGACRPRICIVSPAAPMKGKRSSL